MIVHCSNCSNTESVNISHLQPNNIQKIDLQNFTIDSPTPSGEEFPYAFNDIVECVKESLPLWSVDVITNSDGLVMKTICPKHMDEETILKNFMAEVAKNYHVTKNPIKQCSHHACNCILDILKNIANSINQLLMEIQ